MDSLADVLVLMLVASAAIAALGLLIWATRPDFKVYDVSRSEGGATKTLGGIPFYVKKARHVHVTSYVESLMSVSVEADRVHGDGETARRERVFSGTKTVRWPNRDVASLLEKLDAVTGSSDPEDDLKEAARAFRQLREADARSLDGSELILESNAVEQVVYVDYAVPYHINSRRPRAGTAESTVDISADGTLTKATAKADDKTLAELTGMLPISKLVEKRLSPPTTSPPADPGARGGAVERTPGVRIEVTWEQSPIVVRHTLSEVSKPPDVFQVPPIAWPKDIGAYTGGYRRELAAPPELSESEEKPDNVHSRSTVGGSSSGGEAPR